MAATSTAAELCSTGAGTSQPHRIYEEENHHMNDDDDTQTAENGAESDSERLSDTPEGYESGDGEKGPESPSREAARYRVRAREAEAARDELAKRVETLLTREAERIAAKHLAQPADLFTLSGKSVKDFVGEDGDVDAELVVRAANELLGTRPGLGRNHPAVDPSQGHGGGQGKALPSWGALLK
jgi:hypothetical protein